MTLEATIVQILNGGDPKQIEDVITNLVLRSLTDREAASLIARIAKIIETGVLSG